MEVNEPSPLITYCDGIVAIVRHVGGTCQGPNVTDEGFVPAATVAVAMEVNEPFALITYCETSLLNQFAT